MQTRVMADGEEGKLKVNGRVLEDDRKNILILYISGVCGGRGRKNTRERCHVGKWKSKHHTIPQRKDTKIFVHGIGVPKENNGFCGERVHLIGGERGEGERGIESERDDDADERPRGEMRLETWREEGERVEGRERGEGGEMRIEGGIEVRRGNEIGEKEEEWGGRRKEKGRWRRQNESWGKDVKYGMRGKKKRRGKEEGEEEIGNERKMGGKRERELEKRMRGGEVRGEWKGRTWRGEGEEGRRDRKEEGKEEKRERESDRRDEGLREEMRRVREERGMRRCKWLRYPSVRHSSHISCSSVDSLIVGNEEMGDMCWCVCCCCDDEPPVEENEEMGGMGGFSGVGGLVWVVFLSIAVGF
ncbi:hypothetical protein Tco_0545247 [Tanacetum coccineum]